MKRNNIIRIAAIALIAFIAVGVSSCKKDLRSKTYTMSTYNSSGVSGTVEFAEKEDGSTTIKIKMMGTTNGAMYPAHIHGGAITAPGSIQIDFGTITSVGTSAEKNQDVSTRYEDMLSYNGCFVAHEPGNLANYVLVGNIGSNAP